ncbi:MAG: FkbM family methyltransferase, partial [Syntrophobacterales bacterium]|nr:FkbM family methyltransferase [Syntrophobacterales bacterium]
PLKLLPSNMVMPIWQGRLKGRKWIVGSSNHGCWLGSYEYEKRLLFESTVKEGSIVFDVGAHVGYYSLLASILVGSAGRVVAFEPLPENVAYLKKHIQLNHLKNVIVIKKAVSDCTGEALFQEGSSRSTGHLSSQGNLKIQTISLDDFVRENPGLAPDYLKIDVEGAELAVLVGARKLLAEKRPTIFLATHGREIHRECCDFLLARGYQLSPIGLKSIEDADGILASMVRCCHETKQEKREK